MFCKWWCSVFVEQPHFEIFRLEASFFCAQTLYSVSVIFKVHELYMEVTPPCTCAFDGFVRMGEALSYMWVFDYFYAND